MVAQEWIIDANDATDSQYKDLVFDVQAYNIHKIMKILYVTSFTSEMPYGFKMVETFNKIQRKGDLLVCFEKIGDQSYSGPRSNRIIVCGLNESKYLRTWLRENRDVIPSRFRPASTNPIDLPEPIGLNAWNVKASLWFRKIASLHRAYYRYREHYDAIVWVDADCIWIQNISDGLI